VERVDLRAGRGRGGGIKPNQCRAEVELVNNLIQVWARDNPSFCVVERKGAAHVVTWNDNGYLVRAICGVRPPVREPKYLRPPGDRGLFMYRLGLEGPFSPEEEAPKDRQRLKVVIGLVTCETCNAVFRGAVNETWKARNLLQYLPPEERADL
jgi:hypothetical protein